VVSNTIDYYNTKVSVFKAGQISGRIFQWKNLKHDKDILQIIKGAKIEFQNEPPVKHYAINPKLNKTENSAVDSEIKKLLGKGIIHTCYHENIEFVSPILLILKPDKTYRMILNLKEFKNNLLNMNILKCREYKISVT